MCKGVFKMNEKLKSGFYELPDDIQNRKLFLFYKNKTMLYDLLKNNPKNIDTLHNFLLGNYGADFLSTFLEMCQDLDDITTGIDGFLSGIKDDTIKNMLLVIVLDILVDNHLIKEVNDV